ncbi:LAQU0S13e02652g1_1 [Lachancea quebecensis]|uniref:LAQU0S13e02652g1_1 n=1 Tax=Lachancea quebecensis TaxID=1654605 RepID=A0A0P1KVP8_9SACH|nr:LAQU0S13e02652g1_1 [Lachancea quebecensis]
MIHPIQSLLATNDGSILFFVVKNTLHVLRWEEGRGEFIAIGIWVDDANNSESIKAKVREEQQRQLAENEAKRQKTNDGSSSKSAVKEAKVPVPGQGAPPVYKHIRNMALSRDETLLMACTDSDKALVVFELDYTNTENCLKLRKRQPLPKRPNALTTTTDDDTVLVADKFGDVYALSTKEGVVQETALEPILGHVSLLTDIAVAKEADGKQLIITADRDEHIRITHYPQTFVINKWLFGSKQFVSTLCLPSWGSNLLFSGGGDSLVHSWNWESGKLLDSLDISEIVEPYLGEAQLAPEKFQNETNSLIEYAVAKVVTFANIPYIAFFVEQTKVVLICRVDPDIGIITLAQKIEVPFNIISLSSALSANLLILTLDNRDSDDSRFAAFISYDGTEFLVDAEKNNAFEKCILHKFENDPVVNVEPQDVYPLYHIASLRKRGEHFS